MGVCICWYGCIKSWGATRAMERGSGRPLAGRFCSISSPPFLRWVVTRATSIGSQPRSAVTKNGCSPAGPTALPGRLPSRPCRGPLDIAFSHELPTPSPISITRSLLNWLIFLLISRHNSLYPFSDISTFATIQTAIGRYHSKVYSYSRFFPLRGSWLLALYMMHISACGSLMRILTGIYQESHIISILRK